MSLLTSSERCACTDALVFGKGGTALLEGGHEGLDAFVVEIAGGAYFVKILGELGCYLAKIERVEGFFGSCVVRLLKGVI